MEAFQDCTGLASVVFAPRVPTAFIAWAVGSSRHRTNWQLTTLKQTRNVLHLITQLALERRDIRSVDRSGEKRVFGGCTGLNGTECW